MFSYHGALNISAFWNWTHNLCTWDLCSLFIRILCDRRPVFTYVSTLCGLGCKPCQHPSTLLIVLDYSIGVVHCLTESPPTRSLLLQDPVPTPSDIMIVLYFFITWTDVPIQVSSYDVLPCLETALDVLYLRCYHIVIDCRAEEQTHTLPTFHLFAVLVMSIMVLVTDTIKLLYSLMLLSSVCCIAPNKLHRHFLHSCPACITVLLYITTCLRATVLFISQIVDQVFLSS